jgi:hypothetical protein
MACPKFLESDGLNRLAVFGGTALHHPEKRTSSRTSLKAIGELQLEDDLIGKLSAGSSIWS